MRWLRGGDPLYLLTLLPFAGALLLAFRAPRIHLLLDYWHVLAKVTDDEGTLVVGALFDYHLDQPFAIPALLFWLDTALFAGDNRALTVFSVLLAAAVVGLLHLMLPAGLPTAKKAALTSAFAFLLLSPHGVELWLQGTNGISWLPALFFLVLAVALMHRGSLGLALVAAAAASLSFGVGLPAWFAIALVAWTRGEPRWKVVTPATVGLAVTGLWLLTRSSAQHSLASSEFEPGRRIVVLFSVLGASWSPGVTSPAVVAGVVLVGILLVFIGSGLSNPGINPERAGWAGLAACAPALALLIALGRTTSAEVAENVGLVSRYSLVSGLASCAALALLTLSWPRVRVRTVVTVALVAGATTQLLGYPKIAEVRSEYESIGVAAVALRVQARDALPELRIQPDVIPAARAMGAYPFTNDFTLGCAGTELGDRVDVRAAGTATGVVDSGTPSGGELLRGWAAVDGNRPDCVLVADATGVVVGGGITGLARPDATVASGGEPRSGWLAVAAPGVTEPSVLVTAGAKLYRVHVAG